jgi:hypothetical protein
VIVSPWYLTWLIPFAAAEADRRWQDLILQITLVSAPSRCVPLLWLVLPLCQGVGLLALLVWMRMPALIKATPADA